MKSVKFNSLEDLKKAMAEIVEHSLTAYRFDFYKNDINILNRENEDINKKESATDVFFWEVRECGTWLLPIHMESKYFNMSRYYSFEKAVLNAYGHDTYYLISFKKHSHEISYSIEKSNKETVRKEVEKAYKAYKFKEM